MAHYLFETTWGVTAPIEEVFEVLAHPETFSTWWPSVETSSLVDEGDSTGVGARATYVIRSPLLYRMRFDFRALEVDRPNRLHAVVRGDLVGTGTYLLESRGEETHIRFNWYVSTTKRWMNRVAVIAKPVLARAHHHVMREGCNALARHLKARLISVETKLVETPTPVAAVPPQGSRTIEVRNVFGTFGEEDGEPWR